MSPKKISFLVLICDAKTWSPKKEDKTVSDTELSLRADRMFDFVQEMGDLKLALWSWCHPKNLFLGLDLWCKDLVPKKEDKTISDSGLSLRADRMFDFVQEMGD